MNCRYCFQPLARSALGRPPSFCSAACKQAHYRLKKSGFVRQRVSSAARRLSLLNVAGAALFVDLTVTKSWRIYSQVDWTESV